MIYVPRSLEILYSSTGNGALRRLWSALARHSLPRSGKYPTQITNKMQALLCSEINEDDASQISYHEFLGHHTHDNAQSSGLLVNVATFYINNFEFGVESVPVVWFSVF
jgi:hypothetical protein